MDRYFLSRTLAMPFGYELSNLAAPKGDLATTKANAAFGSPLLYSNQRATRKLLSACGWRAGLHAFFTRLREFSVSSEIVRMGINQPHPLGWLSPRMPLYQAHLGVHSGPL